jgi:hypothetical protein
MIDPKGDITNLLLHFPGLSPQDFQPWLTRDQARQEGKTLEQAAEVAAKIWKDGLARGSSKNASRVEVNDPVHHIHAWLDFGCSSKHPGIAKRPRSLGKGTRKLYGSKSPAR